MDNQTIIENNKLIAKFMGARFISDGMNAPDSKDVFIPIFGSCRVDTIDLGKGKILKFHASWEWIMPVVEKINNFKIQGNPEIRIGKRTELFYSPLVDNGDNVQNLFKSYPDASVISVYLIVTEFINWYNENK